MEYILNWQKNIMTGSHFQLEISEGRSKSFTAGLFVKLGFIGIFESSMSGSINKSSFFRKAFRMQVVKLGVIWKLRSYLQAMSTIEGS